MKINWKIPSNWNQFFVGPVLLALGMLVVSLFMLFVDIKSGLILLLFSLVILYVLYETYKRYGVQITKQLVLFGANYAQVQKRLIHDMAIPYAMVDVRGELLWMNQAFRVATEGSRKNRKNIVELFSEVPPAFFAEEREEGEFHIHYQEKIYRILLKKVMLDSIVEAVSEEELSQSNEWVYAAYLFDETELLRYKNMVAEEELIAGLIYLDNYDEVLESIEEVRRSLNMALLDRHITKYIQSFGGIVKKLDSDKYLILIKNKDLTQMEEQHFAILDKIKNVKISSPMLPTISIGLGAGGENYAQNFEYARAAIDMALGRGGDQVVLKTGDQFTYYGGKVQAQEKSTRVKARVKAQALRTHIESKDKVMIMGHHLSDADCIGAASGMYRAARFSGKRAYIVVNTVTRSTEPVIDQFKANKEYEPDMFIDNRTAIELMDENTLLIIVDVNRPSYTECPELIERADEIVVIDHHRLTQETIPNTVSCYVETFASSASEMVAEILQYYSDKVRIQREEADAMLAGIIVDTNNFMNKTNIRTFEAAAFLRKNGADVTRVHRMFKEELEDCRARAEVIRNAELFEECYLIGQCPNNTKETPTIVAAQAANEMLDIKGIKATFVITEYQNLIYISARSVEGVNVQRAMEMLGGGGHLNLAGAQLQDSDPEEARAKIKDVLIHLKENQEI